MQVAVYTHQLINCYIDEAKFSSIKQCLASDPSDLVNTTCFD